MALSSSSPNQRQIHHKPTSPNPKKALKSLALSIFLPLSLTSASIIFFGSATKPLTTFPFFPPLWLIHAAELGFSCLMGLAAWLVWVDRGFRRTNSDALALYVAHVALCVTWDPLVVKIGAAEIGFVFCVVNFGTVVAVAAEFRKVNRLAGELVRPCMAWMAMLTLLTFKLIDISKMVDLSDLRLYD